MTTPEKDGAPQAWAVEQARQLLEPWINLGEVADVTVLRDDIARALQATREKALLSREVADNAQRMAMLVAGLQIYGRLSMTENDWANEVLKIHNDWYRGYLIEQEPKK